MSQEKIIAYQTNRLSGVTGVDTELFRFEAETSLQIAYNEGMKKADKAIQEILDLTKKAIVRKLPQDEIMIDIHRKAKNFLDGK